MTGRDRIEALFQRRLGALLKNLPSARRGNPEALHRTRVASRRVREALPLLDGCVDTGKLSKTRRQTRRLTRTLGTVRELDVALKLLDGVTATRPAQRLAIERLREHLTRERDELRQAMLTRLADLKPDRVVQKIAGRVESRERDTGETWRPTLAERLRRRATQLRRALKAAGPLYEPDRLHNVRIAVKKLRYVLELAGETKNGGNAAALKSLKGAQELLGDMHDRQRVIHHLRQVQANAAATVGETRELDRLARTMESQCRTLHAQFAARADALLRLTEVLRDDAARGPERRDGPSAKRGTTAADRRR